MRRCTAFPWLAVAPSVHGGHGGTAPAGHAPSPPPHPPPHPPPVWSLRRSATVSAAVAVAALALAGEAAAQDLYVRGGAGLDRASQTGISDWSCSGSTPVPSYDCAAGNEASPLRPLRDFEIAPVFELDTGSALVPEVRIERIPEYSPDFALEGRANVDDAGGRRPGSAQRSPLSELLAPLADLPAIGGFETGSLSPFIGGGLGAVRMRTGEARISFPKGGTIVPGEGRVGRAWTVTAGLAVTMGSRSTLELAWRYSDLGTVGTGQGSGRVEWRERGTGTTLNPAPTSVETRTHGFRLSLRYGF